MTNTHKKKSQQEKKAVVQILKKIEDFIYKPVFPTPQEGKQQ